MKYLSERVSVDSAPGRTSIVISARLSKGKETLLVTWFVAWVLCGAYIIVEVAGLPTGDLRQYLLVFLAFWTYFLLRIGRSVAWRTKGFELLRVRNGVFTIKNSLFGYGKARDFFIANIERLGPLNIDERSWKWQLNESFWVMGGDRLGFEHMGDKVAFGKGLTEEEATRVLQVLKKSFAAERKAEQ